MGDQKIKKRTALSVFSLFFQSGYSAILGFAANLILTILLSPKIFGIYITVLSIISFLNYFSDIGLAASLIQKKDLKEEDVRTTFTLQQILIIALITIGFFLSSYIKNFYSLPIEGLYLYWALLISFFISSLKTIPSVFLERKIQFQKIVLVQIVENTVFYLSVILFAIGGFGLTSFTFAVLLRAIAGLILMYTISFWLPKMGISIQSMRELLSFGIPFQASSFLALFKDDLIILFLGKILGFEGLGYIGWAKKWAEAPIRIVADNVTKVLFPVIARFQNDKEKIGKIVEKMLYYQTALLAPLMMTALFIMPKLIHIIPKYEKWEPALPFFYIFTISSFFVIYSAPFINLFNALGKVKISFSFMLFWTAVTWILTPVFTARFGLYGFPLVHLAISLTFVLVIYTAKAHIPFRFIDSTNAFLLSLIPLVGILFIIERFQFLHEIVSILSMVIFGSLVYLLSLLSVFRININKAIRYLFDLI